VKHLDEFLSVKTIVRTMLDEGKSHLAYQQLVDYDVFGEKLLTVLSVDELKSIRNKHFSEL